ncbi:hypothetical protein K491DRAFT_601390 [Lophiostoma macrostomum CBS 122681]|uniref:SET domain-containing protein n=1 Tax=Lophiostoma macrostomum CBS 122681 TaxID=1314788 RepID=A0A6A6T2B7_9PLEO|nr:hypothetical protein K491DRAFT_601390 [Lophiostoma macrostomum CBS 122681]
MADRNTSPASTSSAVSCVTVGTEQQSASLSSAAASPLMSTPPTSLGDEASVLSDAAKMEVTAESHEESLVLVAQTEAQTTPQPTPAVTQSEGRRPARRSRGAVTTYNVQILAGTAIHTPTKYLEKHHGNVLHGSLEDVRPTNTAPSPKKKTPKRVAEDISDPAEAQLATETAQAAQRRKSSRPDLRKDALRNSAAAGDVVQKATGAIVRAGSKLLGSLRIDMNDSGPSGYQQSAEKKVIAKRERGALPVEAENKEEEVGEEEQEYAQPKSKQWLQQGLFVGQDRDFNPRFSETKNRSRRQSKQIKKAPALPLPMFSMEEKLEDNDFRRDFKLPFDVYHPLPKKVKVDGWVKLQKNRFIGDASALWKRDKQDSSSCYCLPEEGCGEACHNRIMAYECDSTNCKLTSEQCGNRPFAELKRRAKGNGYDYGVEVAETEDRGYGVRAMRTFDPHQIIVEYAGEIITQTECERRMKQVYKRDKCYYLMSFDNKMIIDATRGTIARFVNHSCEPNCEMIKWTVNGEPRMALFAGSRGIMTGEELTYDYNFDPFSSKTMQTCRCGTRSCRGVLGPKPKHQQPQKESLATTIVAGAKRKFQDFMGMGSSSGSAPSSPKKRKTSAYANAHVIKHQNAVAEKSAAHEKAEKTKAEAAAQAASRQNRALRRSTSMILSSSRRTKVRRTRHSLPITKTSRHTTTIDYKRRTPKPGFVKPGTLKAIRKTVQRTPLALSKSRVSSFKTPKSQARDATPESSSESSDESPNITPASLRSANKKSLKQTQLNFKPLNFGASSSRSSDDSLKFPDSDSDFEDAEPRVKRFKKGLATTTSVRGSVKKTVSRSIKGTKRTFKGLSGRATSGVDD